MNEFSIRDQILEVEREIGQRESVYARLVAARKMRKAEAEFFMGRMKAVLKTLEWLRDNETAIKAKVAA